MGRATEETGVLLIRPLWQIPRDKLVKELAYKGFEIVVSCTNIDKMGQSVSEDSVGKSYYDVYEKLKVMDGIDRARESGEFHTMVLNAPSFKKRIEFTGNLQTDETGHYLYLNFDHIQLVIK
jgi:diphthamide synthase (EF-2-diphthine--ammonia ligase)